MVKYVPVVLFSSDLHRKVYGVAWSPDAMRLVAVTRAGSVIQFTKKNGHLTVYKKSTFVRICVLLFFAHSFITNS